MTEHRPLFSRPSGGTLRRLTFIGLFCILLAACGSSDETERRAPTPAREEWIIHSRIDVRQGNLKDTEFRLIVPFVSGDLYGNPTSSSYLVASVESNAFEIDLNQGHDAMLAELRESKFYVRDMKIEPRDARIANFSPEIVDRRGKSLGITNWVDAESNRVLRLVYFDRPARITGRTFDIQVTEAGYVWVEMLSSPGLANVVPQPNKLVLAFFRK